MIDNISKLRNATNNYRLNNKYEITENTLKYIQERILANKNEIEELIKLKEEKYKYEDIKNAIDEEIKKEIRYKDYRRMYINKEKFISTSLLMPIGVIAVEAFDTIEVIKYLVRAIKSRNSIAISDVEYDEHSVKFLILEIFKEALKKFGIDQNLIMILPYEECFYKYFDKVIYTYDETGKTLTENRYDNKEESERKYIYIEDKKLEEIAKRDNNDGEIVYGNIEEVIEKINTIYSKGATIYTSNSQIAYEFINLVQSKNVMVNASLQNVEDIRKSSNEMYEYKNIILPIPRELIEEVKKKVEKKTTEETSELSLVKVNEGVLEKIKRFFRRTFKK